MLICVKEKRAAGQSEWDDAENRLKSSRCTLKGSILIKKHLKQVSESQGTHLYPYHSNATAKPLSRLSSKKQNEKDFSGSNGRV